MSTDNKSVSYLFMTRVANLATLRRRVIRKKKRTASHDDYGPFPAPISEPFSGMTSMTDVTNVTVRHGGEKRDMT